MQAMQVQKLFSMLRNPAVKKSFQEELPPAWQRAGAELSWPGALSLRSSCAARAERPPRPASCSGQWCPPQPQPPPDQALQRQPSSCRYA